MRAAAIVLAALLLAPPALADEVVVLEEGKPAPFTGLLVTEARFKAYADQQVLAERCSSALDLCNSQPATKESIWSQSKFWVGAGLGAALAAVLFAGAIQVVKVSQ